MPLVRAAPTARHYRSGPAPAGQTNNGRFRNSTSTTEYERRLATAVPPSGLNNPTERSWGPDPSFLRSAPGSRRVRTHSRLSATLSGAAETIPNAFKWGALAYSGAEVVRLHRNLPAGTDVRPLDVVDEPGQAVPALLQDGDALIQIGQLRREGRGEFGALLDRVRHRGLAVEQILQCLLDHMSRQRRGEHAANVPHALDVRLGEGPIAGAGSGRRQQALLFVVAQHPDRGPGAQAQVSDLHTLTLTSMSGFSFVFMILIVLMICSFAVATTEFVLVGMLPEISGSLGVSVATA